MKYRILIIWWGNVYNFETVSLSNIQTMTKYIVADCPREFWRLEEKYQTWNRNKKMQCNYLMPLDRIFFFRRTCCNFANWSFQTTGRVQHLHSWWMPHLTRKLHSSTSSAIYEDFIEPTIVYIIPRNRHKLRRYHKYS